MTTDIAVAVESLRPLRGAEAQHLADVQARRMIELLGQLDAAQWTAPTDCEGWRVRDVVAHLIGWQEWLTSPREAGRQTKETLRRRKEFANILDAQNEVQVDGRRDLPTDQLVASARAAFAKGLRMRKRLAAPGRVVPFVYPYIGRTNVGFLMNTIFTRDMFMHRIDIARAVGVELEAGAEEARIVADVVRDWAQRARAHLRLDLTGPAGGSFVAGTWRNATIRGDAIEFCRLVAGRGSPDSFDTEGDTAAAARWLAVPCPF